jgi:2-keto-4-pentenoate hydratase/2-oxohepta-3-ene-1,7-dioic acid hydratase in catechol pathway
MRFIRYQQGNSQPRYGWVNNEMVGQIDGSLYGAYRRLEAATPLAEVKLLVPVEPEKIICIGRNYVEHAKEHGSEVPDIPLIFLKPPTTLIAHKEKILLPPQSKLVEHEAELAVVIGKQGRWISQDKVKEHILGYTIGNDVTARDLQRRDGQWTRGKSFDTFCPLGPWVDTDVDPSDLLITCRVNNQLRQMASTHEMVFSVVQLVVFISSVMTLNPGDVILTGTPAGVGPLLEGDVLETSIDGIGVLQNPVVNDTSHVK